MKIKPFFLNKLYLTENFDIASETVILSKTAGNLLDDLLDNAVTKGNELTFVYNYCLSEAALTRKGCHATAAIPYAGAKVAGKILGITPMKRKTRKRWGKKINHIESELRQERLKAYFPNPKPKDMESGIRKYKKRVADIREALLRLQEVDLSEKQINSLTLDQLEAVSRANRMPDSVERRTFLETAFTGSKGENMINRLIDHGAISNMPVSPRVYGIFGRQISSKEMEVLAKAGDMPVFARESFLRNSGIDDKVITQLLEDPNTLSTPPSFNALRRDITIFTRGIPSEFGIIRTQARNAIRQTLNPRQMQAILRIQAAIRQADGAFSGMDRLTQLRAARDILQDTGLKRSDIKKLIQTNVLMIGDITSNQMNQLFP